MQNTVELKAPLYKIIDKELYFIKTYFELSWTGGWSNTNSYISWEIDVRKAGKYEFFMKYICDWEDIGSIVYIETANGKLEAEITEGYDYKLDESNELVYRHTIPFNPEWKILKFGAIELKEGRQTLSLKASKINGRLIADVRSVILKRVM
jgi:hypothetical protein